MIQAVGVFTSAGVRAPTAFGSARLNLKFFEELPWKDAAGAPMVGGRTPLDLVEVDGADRLVTMAALALRDCAAVPVPPAVRGVPEPPAPLLLCLPDPVPDQPSRPPSDMLAVLAADPGAPAIDLASSRAFASGRPAIFDALDEAGRLLARPTTPTVYLGGSDSLVEGMTLDRWLRAGRLKTSTTEGFIPGEGAVFLRLQRQAAPGALALLTGWASAQEPRTREATEPNVGAGLAEAARAALAAAGVEGAEVDAILHDAAGDRFGFREVSLAVARLRPRADPPPVVTSAAASTGEVGAAYGPFALALAAYLHARGVSDGPITLILGSSDGGARGAAVVTRASAPSARGAR